MATVIKIKKKPGKATTKVNPLPKKLLAAPQLTKKQIKTIEEAGKLIGKWKI